MIRRLHISTLCHKATSITNALKIIGNFISGRLPLLSYDACFTSLRVGDNNCSVAVSNLLQSVQTSAAKLISAVYQEDITEKYLEWVISHATISVVNLIFPLFFVTQLLNPAILLFLHLTKDNYPSQFISNYPVQNSLSSQLFFSLRLQTWDFIATVLITLYSRQFPS